MFPRWPRHTGILCAMCIYFNVCQCGQRGSQAERTCPASDCSSSFSDANKIKVKVKMSANMVNPYRHTPQDREVSIPDSSKPELWYLFKQGSWKPEKMDQRVHYWRQTWERIGPAESSLMIKATIIKTLTLQRWIPLYIVMQFQPPKLKDNLAQPDRKHVFSIRR